MKVMHKKSSHSGFTIVELLIVIVVIAILAAITIVTYNGIQSRGKNQQIVTAVRAYYTALKAYTIDYGSYPVYNGCLGQSDLYTSNPCYIGGSTFTYNSALNTALAPYMNSGVPSLPSDKVTDGTTSASGIFYYSNSKYIGFPALSTGTCPSIAGATLYAQGVWGSDMYCRLNFPTI